MRHHVLSAILLLSACADRIERPKAVPGEAPAAPAVGAPIQLDGSGSTDPQARALSFDWSFARLPAGSLAALHDPTVVNPSLVPDVPGSYVVELVVSNGVLDSAPASLTIDVTACGTAAPAAGALVATPAAPATGQTVGLSAPEAADTDVTDCGLTQTLAYQWALTATPAGSAAALNNPASTKPSFVPDVVGTYTVQLTLTDSTGLWGSATLDVTAGPCGSNPPVALIFMSNPVTTAAAATVFAPDVAVGTDIQVDASGSSDADATSCGLADTLSYAWAFERLAPASNASFNSAVIDPSFTADRPGTYVVRLTVTDSTGLSSTATLTVTADPCVLLALPTEFTCTTVRSGDAMGLHDPHGVTVDGSGNIYVVNRAADNVVRIVPGAISVFAQGGVLNGGGLEDIVFFDGTTDSFFVTDSNDDEIIQLSTTGLPTLFADGNEVQQPRGVAVFADCSGADWLLVASDGDDDIRGFDPTDTAPAVTLLNDLMTTGGGMDLANQPRGVAGQCDGATDRIYATRVGGQDALISDDADIGGNVDAAQTLSTNAVLNRGRDVVLTPCATPKVVVAAGAGNAIVLVDDCGGAGCPVSVLASGLDDVYGLWFESDSSLLVTDPGSDTLFRITAANPAAFDFCDL